MRSSVRKARLNLRRLFMISNVWYNSPIYFLRKRNGI